MSDDLHPFPQLDLIRGTMPQMAQASDFWSDSQRIVEHAPILPPYSLDPAAAERQSLVPPPPHEMRTPAMLHYPRSREVRFVPSGANNTEQMTGFAARAIGVQNVGGNVFLFCPEINMYVTAGPTVLAQYNLPEAHEKLTFQWHTAIGNPVTPAGVAGQQAVIWIYDEWVAPSIVSQGTISAIAGNVAVTIAQTVAVSLAQGFADTATQTSVAGAVASGSLLAANAARKGASFFNDSTATLYLSFGVAASATVHKVQIAAGGYYELAPEAIYRGQIFGIWSAAVGSVRITELT